MRALVVSLLLVGVAGAATPTMHPGGDDPVPRVVEKDGLYEVSATFVVAQPAGIVMAVLTDYERIPEFMPDVKVSRVLERGTGRTVVRQEAVARVLLFSRRIHLDLEITETLGRLRFRDIGGRSFLRYEGEWHLDDDGASTLVNYELTAQPTTTVPKALVLRLFSQDVRKTIEQLKRESARRAARSHPVRQVDAP